MNDIIDSPNQSSQPLVYAGFWIRVAAVIIDAILVQIVAVVLSYIIYGDYSMMIPRPGLQALQGILGIAYYVTMESSVKQATLGKMAVGIQVGDLDGNQISWPNALGRYFSKIVSALILFFGFIMVAWDDRKQGLHDKIAGTVVYYKN